MGSLSNYLKNKLLDHIVGKTSYTMPTNIYIALSTADPGEDGSGIAEPVGNNYSRVQTTGATWTAASGGATTNTADIIFPEPSGSWGTISHVAIFDAPTGGNMLAYDDVPTPKSFGAGEIPRIAAGEFTLNFFDSNNRPFTPDSGFYRIDDSETGTEIKENTEVTPEGSTHVITITSVDNRILDPNKNNEKHIITFKFTYEGRAVSGDLEYYVSRVDNLDKLGD